MDALELMDAKPAWLWNWVVMRHPRAMPDAPFAAQLGTCYPFGSESDYWIEADSADALADKLPGGKGRYIFVPHMRVGIPKVDAMHYGSWMNRAHPLAASIAAKAATISLSPKLSAETAKRTIAAFATHGTYR